MHKHFFLAVTVCMTLAACDKAPDVSTTIKPYATLQEIMLSVIDPNVDPIWNAVSTTVTAAGEVEKVPANDAEWATLRKHAIVLIEAANLLQLPNRQVAVAGASTSIHPVEEDPKAIQTLIQNHQEDFAQKAIALQEAAKLTLVAIDDKNPQLLLKAGERLENTCEACHSQYWYPNDKRPVSLAPLGGQFGKIYTHLRGSVANSESLVGS